MQVEEGPCQPPATARPLKGPFQLKMRRRDEEDYGEACGWRPVGLILSSVALLNLASPCVSFKPIQPEDGKT